MITVLLLSFLSKTDNLNSYLGMPCPDDVHTYTHTVMCADSLTRVPSISKQTCHHNLYFAFIEQKGIGTVK